jgi:hypothetical protein
LVILFFKSKNHLFFFDIIQLNFRHLYRYELNFINESILILLIVFLTRSPQQRVDYLYPRLCKSSAFNTKPSFNNDNIYSTSKLFHGSHQFSSLMQMTPFGHCITAGEKNIDDITDYLSAHQRKIRLDRRFLCINVTGNYYTPTVYEDHISTE